MTSRFYQEYMESEAWKLKRQEAIDRTGGFCNDCSDDATQVHHLTYRNLGHEHPSDLVALGEACHEDRHVDDDPDASSYYDDEYYRYEDW